jgi:ferrous iron transport protein B
MSCSARLPVFVMLTSLLFASRPALAPVAFAGCFMLGAGAAFLSAWVFSRTMFKGRARPMILELPAYQVPSVRNALLAARDQSVSFLKTAGTVIMAICIVMWWLSAYRYPPAKATLRSSRGAGVRAGCAVLVDRADRIGARAQRAGRPAGWGMRFSRCLRRWARLAAERGPADQFPRAEVFVSTMAVLAGAAKTSGASPACGR